MHKLNDFVAIGFKGASKPYLFKASNMKVTRFEDSIFITVPENQRSSSVCTISRLSHGLFNMSSI